MSIIDIPFDSYEPITFLGVNSYYDLGLHTTEPIAIPHPKRKVTQENIVGKNGSITFDEGAYEDIPITVKLAIVETTQEAFYNKINQVKAWLAGGQGQLIIATEPDKYYIAQCIDKFDITPLAEEFGQFPVMFTCKPVKKPLEDDKYIILDQCISRAGSIINPLQAYNFTGGTALSNNIPVRIIDAKQINIFNPGTVDSEPILNIVGSGDISVTLGSSTFSLLGLDDYVTVDTPVKDAYKDTALRNNIMVGDFPTLPCGSNTVSWSGAVSRIEIQCNSNWI